ANNRITTVETRLKVAEELGDTTFEGLAPLPRGQNGDDGFGLYSYILLTNEASNTSEKKRQYESVFEAFQKVGPVLDMIETRDPRFSQKEYKSRLDVFYVPLKSDLPLQLRSREEIDTLLDNEYDYSRAKNLLGFL